MQEIIRLLGQGADIDAAAALGVVRDYNAPTSTIGDLIQFDAVYSLGDPGEYADNTSVFCVLCVLLPF